HSFSHTLSLSLSLSLTLSNTNTFLQFCILTFVCYLFFISRLQEIFFLLYYLGMHRYHFFTNRYEYEYFYLSTCRYRVPIPILLRIGLHESAINLEADFILSSVDYVKPIVQNEQKAIPSQK